MSKRHKKDNRRETFLVDYDTGSDPLAEAFRMLRLQIQTAIKSSHGDTRGKIILITSSVAQEGKTTTACNLAQMCAIAHIPTVLIDADLRKPSVHRAFSLPRSPGISDMLLSGNPDDIPVTATLVPNLSIITAGEHTRHTTEVLGSPPFYKFLSELRNRYSLIIIDSPPAGVVSDVGVLVDKVDAVYIVIRAGLTKVRTVKQVVRTLRDLGGNLQGAIMSRIDPKRDRYYYYYNYPTYYSSYYRDDDDEKSKIKPDKNDPV